MRAEKKVLFSLEKCYAISEISYKGEQCFLIGEEKHDASYIFGKGGNVIAPVWNDPGGVMTMEPVPGKDGEFLSTQEFYSPNDGKSARIVSAFPAGNDKWKVQTLTDLPMVHRFGILSRNSVNYIIACTIKNDYEERDDWRQPGAVYAAPLPDDLENYDSEHQLRLYPIAAGLHRNHGFFKYDDNGVQTALIGSDEGVYEFIPPAAPGDAWEIKHLISQPTSDMVMTDFDEDGKPELGTFTPFHGDDLIIYKLDDNGEYKPVWQLPYKMEMLHATWLGSRNGKPVWFVGCRKGVRQTLAITYGGGTYCADILDDDAGAANAVQLDEDTLVCTNYARGEVTMYKLYD